MTEETPIRPRAEYDAPPEPADPEFIADDLADVTLLLERAAGYAEFHGDATLAAELRRGAAVLNSEVADAE